MVAQKTVPEERMNATRLVAFAGLAVFATAPLGAQQKAKTTKKTEDLASLTKISKDSATKIALAQVAAGSTVKSSELEREKGTIVYSFDLNVPGKTGIDEVLVSAINGHVVSKQYETPKQEKNEAKKEAKEKAKSTKKAAKTP